MPSPKRGAQRRPAATEKPATQAKDAPKKNPTTRANGALKKKPATLANGAPKKKPATLANGAPKKKPATRANGAPKKKLPAALAKRATALAEQKKAELAARGREDIAFILQKQVEIVGSFYDIGAALNRLSEPGIAEALGYGGLSELVERELSMSVAKARDLMGIARLVRREDALRWGQEKSAALVELVQATAAADSPASLAKQRKLEIGKGRVINLEEASATAIQKAAKEVRAARNAGEKPKRGVTASAAERKLAERLQGALHALGEGRARVTAVARAGAAADLRIDRLPVAALATLVKAAAVAQKPV